MTERKRAAKRTTTTTTTTSVDDFLASLPAERRRAVDEVRRVLRQHLPEGYEEAISKKMLVYQVPLARYADTYNGHPLWIAALASEKSYLSLHLMSVYADRAQAQRLEDGFRRAGKKLDMGKACIHFHAAEDLALDVIGDLVAAIPVDRWVAIAKAARQRPRTSRSR